VYDSVYQPRRFFSFRRMALGVASLLHTKRPRGVSPTAPIVTKCKARGIPALVFSFESGYSIGYAGIASSISSIRRSVSLSATTIWQ
jgi:hypothetical protein